MSRKFEETERLDPAKVSAFAIYKNLIPGVTSYEDTNETSVRSRKKKNRKRKLKVETKPEPDIIPVPVEASPETKKKRKKKNKKRKLSETEDGENGDIATLPPMSTNISSEEQSPSPIKMPKKKKNRKEKQTVAYEKDDSPTNIPVQTSQKKKPVAVVEKPKPKVNEVPLMNGVGPKKNPVPMPLNSTPVRTSPRSLDHLFDSGPINDSTVHGREVFEWLLHPTPLEKFFDEHWEKKPLHVKRTTKRDYASWLMSSSTLDEVMRTNFIKFGKNIDITSYIDGVRETHNPEGRARPAVVWDYYSNGNSVRFLNPQTYIKPIWRLNASLQEYLGTFVGANVYLTPPDSQGFAPHYDDIEAFVIQIEGFKHWKLYKPRSRAEELPRFSSKNFNEEIDNLGEPILDVVLGPGDLLYFPRGTIHQAKSIEGEHSLHITLSAYQTNTYGDLLAAHLPMALEQAMKDSVELRRGLPTDFLTFMGLIHCGRNDKRVGEKREAFQKKIKKMAEGILNQTCDLAADQLGKKLIWDSLPPYLTSKEKRRTVYKDGEFIEAGTVLNRVEIGPDVEIKLIRRNACRLVSEEGSLRLYFSLENSLEYHGEEPAYVEMPDNAGPAIEYLFKQYPRFTKVDDIPVDGQELKIQICADLWEKGLLMTNTPLSAYAFDETGDSEDEMEEAGDSTSSEEVSDEEEENDEDRAFIADSDEVEDESDGDERRLVIDEEGSDEEGDPRSFLDVEASDDDDESEDETPPRLIQRKVSRTNNRIKAFIL